MKNVSRIAALGLALAASSAQATVIFNVSDAGVYTTATAGATTVNFNNGTCGAYTSCSGEFAVVTGSVAGRYASPLGITDHYLSIPYANSSGSATFLTPGSFDYFGLYWGSVDTYNSISFFMGSTLVGSYGGANISPPLLADGNQTAWTSNRYVNFFFTGGDLYDRVVLTSTNYAFESDNHAFGNVRANVPEPTTLSLFGLGLLALGFTARRKASLRL